VGKDGRENIQALVCSFLSGGFTLDHGVIHYAESALGIGDEIDLLAMLNTGAAREKGLLGLIISPSTELRLKLELHIPPEGLEHGFINATAAMMLKCVPIIKVSFGERIPTSIETKETDMREFLAKLQLDWPVPTVKPHFLKNPDSLERCLRGRLAWRKYRAPVTPEKENFFMSILKILEKDHSRDLMFRTQALEETVKLFGEDRYNREADELLSKKIAVLRNKQGNKQQFEELASQYSMELLMSRRITAPPVDSEETGRMLARLIYIRNLIAG